VVFLSVSLAVVTLFSGMVVASREAKEEVFQALGNLAEVVHLVRTEYVDELNTEALSLALDAGIVESVDRWSAVLPSDQVEAYEALLSSPPPFGLVLTTRLDSAAVRHTIEGSPARSAGLEDWEVIEQVNGVYTRGRPLWQLRIELKEHQERGEAVTLTVVDRQVDERREVELTPSGWAPEVAGLTERDGAVVVRLEALPRGAVDRLAVLLPAEGGIVLDLRNLVWGHEEEAIAVADLFVDGGILGGWQGRRAGSRTFEATPGSRGSGTPVVVIGSGTEGVGEILASALERSGAVLVGGRTMGHASHMAMVRDGDLNLWLPVGQWLRGDGEIINGNGIEPDEVVEGAAEDDATDPVLDRALDLLAQPLPKAA
jgi:carboxyl-terminal processing protease